MAVSRGEETFALQLRAEKLDGWEREYKFAQNRRWRFDFAHPKSKLAVEVEGGIYSNGRHTRGSGYAADLEKYNRAVILGWRVLRFATHDVTSGAAIQIVSEMIRCQQTKPIA